MTPEYIEELAKRADPDDLWRLSYPQWQKLPEDKKKQRDTAIALRRHADDYRHLLKLMDEGKSLLITQIAAHESAIKSVETPPDHARLRHK